MNATNEYDVGDMVRVEVTFRDVDGLEADPTLVVLRVLNPQTEEEVLPTVAHPSQGVYYGDVSADVWGTWHYRFEGTGAIQAADEGAFYVRKGNF
jgi:hypothetical protein